MEALCIFSRVPACAHARRIVLVLSAIFFVLPGSGVAQQNELSQQPATNTAHDRGSVAPASLQDLIREAERNNPEIAAAERGYAAATHMARQASALPDTQVTLQQLNVGSPRPFAGYTNSDFAYIGLGASQEIPFPGKRGLRGEVANRDAIA